MKKMAYNFLNEHDFNVRVSTLNEFVNTKGEQDAYIELIRDSLGITIINSPKVFIGNYIFMNNDGEISTKSFQEKGNKLIENLPAEVKNSSVVRFNIRLNEGGYKSWIISRSHNICKQLEIGDFNVRVSSLKKQHDSMANMASNYYELVRDSLGESIVNNSNILIGNYIVLNSEEQRKMRPFTLKGTSIMSNIKPELRRCVSIRINIRLKQGGFKSWIIKKD